MRILLIIIAVILLSGCCQQSYRTWSYIPDRSDELIHKLQEPITYNCSDISFEDCMNYFSTQYKINIVLAKGVRGSMPPEVTIDLKNVRLGSAMEAIAIVSGVTLITKDNIIYITYFGELQ